MKRRFGLRLSDVAMMRLSCQAGEPAVWAGARRSSSRAAALLQLAATTIGRSDTALGAFYRRLAGRIGKQRAVTATARRIAVLFYNALRFGMVYRDPGAAAYVERHRSRALANLQRRARSLAYQLEFMSAETCVS
jgi:hypothetical protein